MAEEKKNDKRGGPRKNSGGRRPGAGRKPNYIKKAGIPPVSAHHLLAIIDQEKLVRRLLQSKSDDVVLRTLVSLREMAYGKPKQAMQFGGGIGVAHFDNHPGDGSTLSARLLRAQQRCSDGTTLEALTVEQLQARIAELQEDLGLVEPVIEAAPNRPLQLTAPSESAQKAETDSIPSIVPSAPCRVPSVNVPGLNVPAQTGHCDKHGPFTPKSKWEPTCPECKFEWEQQNRADQEKLSRLMPGEPFWTHSR